MAWRKDFFPESESEMLAFSANFAARISADFAGYFLTEQQAADYVEIQQAFAQMHQLANSPGTRTGPVITSKNEKRKALERRSRELARTIKSRSSIPVTK